MQAELLRDKVISEEQIIEFRNLFVSQYCDQNKWNKDNLTLEQIMEIRSHKGWKYAGLVIG